MGDLNYNKKWTKNSQKVKNGKERQVRSGVLTPDLKEVFKTNIQNILLELNWLREVIIERMAVLSGGETTGIQASIHEILLLPELGLSSYFDLVNKYQLDHAERLMLILSFAAEYKPDILDMLLAANPKNKQRYRAIGGKIEAEYETLVPTLQTVLFLLAGDNDEMAASYLYQLKEDNILFKEQILHLNTPASGTGYLPSFEIRLDSAYYNYFLFSERPRLDDGDDFPARLLETDRTFDDLILPTSTLDHLKAPMDYVRNQAKVFGKKGVASKMNSGHVAMLYGPPGTGKTLTASVIGKHLGVDVYAIELSQVVSKYIGETEKNIDKIFDRLHDKNCIIFFDEADALFGKRTEIKDSKDKFANQETSHLLQKIEKCKALVILASNYRQNLDEAFKRRILTYVHIPPPEKPERLKMWRNALPEVYEYEPVDLPEKLAADYQLTGSNIANVIKLSCFDAESEGMTSLTFERIEHFIAKELLKENRKSMISKPTQSLKPKTAQSKHSSKATIEAEETPELEEVAEPEEMPEPEAIEPPALAEGSRVMSMSEAEARRRGLLPNTPTKLNSRRRRG